MEKGKEQQDFYYTKFHNPQKSHEKPLLNACFITSGRRLRNLSEGMSGMSEANGANPLEKESSHHMLPRRGCVNETKCMNGPNLVISDSVSSIGR